MKLRLSMRIVVITLFAALAMPVQLAAQHTRYKLVAIRTFGGPTSSLNVGDDEGVFSGNVLNNRGAIAGWADTAKPDPFPTFCFFDCFVNHAFRWQDGIFTDLGALRKGVSSQALWLSDSGLIAGVSQNGDIDPLLPGFPEFRAVLWRNGTITDLGTLEGGHESAANTVNSRGQVAGWFQNTIPDPFCMLAPGFCPTQTRAFRWEGGVVQDLGTLGGTDAIAQFINERGQVVGWSYTSSALNTSCPGSNFPTQFPIALGSFIWDKQNGMSCAWRRAPQRSMKTEFGGSMLCRGVWSRGLRPYWCLRARG